MVAGGQGTRLGYDGPKGRYPVGPLTRRSLFAYHAHRVLASCRSYDAELRRALGLLLEKWGMTVLEAASGEEALALIEEIGILPDIFLVDHQLGDGITGIEFLARIRAAHGVVPARLITANRGWDVRAAATSAGAEILYKPIDPRALEAVVGRL